MVTVDSTKLDVIGQVALPGPADLVVYHLETNRVFVCNDDKPEMWVIDPMEKMIASTINFPGGIAFAKNGQPYVQAFTGK